MITQYMKMTKNFKRSLLKGDFRSISSNLEPSLFSEMNFECRECNNKFKSVDELTLHMQLHKQQKLDTCPECGYTSSDRDRLRAHMRM